jgi:circadian clock protein KaiB
MTGMSIAQLSPPPLHILLFVAGEESHSRAARANLAHIQECCLGDKSQIEVVNVLEDYRKALEWRVILTPTLLVVSPPPVVRIIGTLDDTSRVLALLQSKSAVAAS